MGLDPRRVAHLYFGMLKRLGRLNAEEIQQLGEPVEKLAQKFELPPKSERLLLDQPA